MNSLLRSRRRLSPNTRCDAVGAILDFGQTYGGRAYRDCIAGARASRAGRYRASRDAVVVGRRRRTRRAGAGTAVSGRYRRRRNERTASSPCSTTGAQTDGNSGRCSPVTPTRRGKRNFSRAASICTPMFSRSSTGSRYASTPAFTAAVSAQLALISAGRHNTFGHPGASTLATLAHVDATIYRTDHCGALTLAVDRGRSTTMLPCLLMSRTTNRSTIASMQVASGRQLSSANLAPSDKR